MLLIGGLQNKGTVLDDLGGLNVITRVPMGEREAKETDQRWHPEEDSTGRRWL